MRIVPCSRFSLLSLFIDYFFYGKPFFNLNNLYRWNECDDGRNCIVSLMEVASHKMGFEREEKNKWRRVSDHLVKVFFNGKFKMK